ncbi:MAG: hypothetical protein ACI89W_000641 [Gammaproteobacteria bacterium]|jgi:hypothetical protein
MQEISAINMVLLSISLLGLGVAIIAIQSNRKLSLRLNKALELINSLHKFNETHQTNFTAFENKQDKLHEKNKQALTSELEDMLCSLKTSTSQAHAFDIEMIKIDVDKLMAQIDELSQQDPAAKMYARAHSLVESGATISEIMDACDLPQAEVEVLIGFQKKARK